jgi:hypothetical protein
MQHQRLVETDAGMAVGEAAELSGRRQGHAAWRVEDDEVIAHAVHLREVDAHCV